MICVNHIISYGILDKTLLYEHYTRGRKMTREEELENLVEVTVYNLKNQIANHQREKELADENIKRCTILYSDLESKLNQINKVHKKTEG
jgi:hypothetical protein